MATAIRTYHGRTQRDAAKLYGEDADALAALGFSPIAQSWAEGRSGCLRMIMLGFILAYFIRPAGTLTVTYTGPDGVALPPQPVPPRNWTPWIALGVIVLFFIFLVALGGSK